ncbi:MAG TPA: hypothetical protein VN627_07840 [Novosphingobium sp.]|nr:hypothetical protein [Novosphingobium sp.]
MPLAQVTVLLPKLPDGGEVSRVMAAKAGVAAASNGKAAKDTNLFIIGDSFLFIWQSAIVALALNGALSLCFQRLMPICDERLAP